MRKQNILPAVLYGKTIENKNIQVGYRDVDKILRTKLGQNTLITLKIEGDKEYSALIKDFQGDAVTRAMTHVDFWNVTPDQIVAVDIETRIEGKAPGILKGGLIEHPTHFLKLLCRADSIPSEIVIDISSLDINENIHLKDIQLPSGVSARANYNPTIVACVQERAEEVAATAAAGASPAGAPAAGAPAAGAAAAPAAAAPAAAAKKK